MGKLTSVQKAVQEGWDLTRKLDKGKHADAFIKGRYASKARYSELKPEAMEEIKSLLPDLTHIKETLGPKIGRHQRDAILDSLATTPQRKALINKIREPLHKFLEQNEDKLDRADIMGSMTTDKVAPGDVDVFARPNVNEFDPDVLGELNEAGRRADPADIMKTLDSELHIISPNFINPETRDLAGDFLKATGDMKYATPKKKHNWIRILSALGVAGVGVGAADEAEACWGKGCIRKLRKFYPELKSAVLKKKYPLLNEKGYLDEEDVVEEISSGVAGAALDLNQRMSNPINRKVVRDYTIKMYDTMEEKLRRNPNINPYHVLPNEDTSWMGELYKKVDRTRAIKLGAGIGAGALLTQPNEAEALTKGVSSTAQRLMGTKIGQKVIKKISGSNRNLDVRTIHFTDGTKQQVTKDQLRSYITAKGQHTYKNIHGVNKVVDPDEADAMVMRSLARRLKQAQKNNLSKLGVEEGLHKYVKGTSEIDVDSIPDSVIIRFQKKHFSIPRFYYEELKRLMPNEIKLMNKESKPKKIAYDFGGAEYPDVDEEAKNVRNVIVDKYPKKDFMGKGKDGTWMLETQKEVGFKGDYISHDLTKPIKLPPGDSVNIGAMLRYIPEKVRGLGWLTGEKLTVKDIKTFEVVADNIDNALKPGGKVTIRDYKEVTFPIIRNLTKRGYKLSKPDLLEYANEDMPAVYLFKLTKGSKK